MGVNGREWKRLTFAGFRSFGRGDLDCTITRSNTFPMGVVYHQPSSCHLGGGKLTTGTQTFSHFLSIFPPPSHFSISSGTPTANWKNRLSPVACILESRGLASDLNFLNSISYIFSALLFVVVFTGACACAGGVGCREAGSRSGDFGFSLITFL